MTIKNGMHQKWAGRILSAAVGDLSFSVGGNVVNRYYPECVYIRTEVSGVTITAAAAQLMLDTYARELSPADKSFLRSVK